jgi:4-aminobutyrate aminotransferase-like enzyme
VAEVNYPSNEDLKAIRKKNFLPTAALYHKEPIQLVKATGCYVWDSEGKQYLDAIGGIVCISSGHNHPKIKAAMNQMIDSDELQHTSLLYLSRRTTEAAEQLVAETPEGLDRVAFTNSGSEANEIAFMALRQKTGENVIVSLKHGYHGGTSGTIAQCGQYTWKFRGQPNSGTVHAEAPYCYRCPWKKTPDSCAMECVKNVEDTIQTTTHGKIAGMIIEPIMGVGGFITPPEDYYNEVAKIVHEYGGYYISDEVQTGAGRCSEEFLLTKGLGIDADVITMAKGYGNGAAIGAAVMRDEIAESLAGKLHFNTFGGDPYQAMQAKVNLEIIKEEKLTENAMAMGKILMDGLKDLMKTHDLIGDVRGRGLLMGFELVKDRKTKEYATEETGLLMDICKDKGLLLGKGGLKGNVMRVAPPLSINREQVNTMLKIIDESLAELKGRKAA